MNKSYIISCALTGILTLLLGTFIYSQNRSSNVNKIGFLLSLSISLWSLSLFVKEVYIEKTTAFFFVRLAYAGSIFIPSLFFHFVISLLNLSKHKLILSFYALSIIFLFSDFTPLFIKDVKPILFFNYYGIPGIVFPFFVISFVAIISYSHFILIKYFRKSEGQVRNQIKYLLFAAIIGFSGGVLTFLPNFNIKVFPFGFYLISIYVVITSYAIVKHRLMDINIVLKKGTTYAVLILVLFVPSSLLIILGQEFFYKEVNYPFFIFILSILLLVAVFFYRVKPGTEKAVEQFLFGCRYDYRETLGKFSRDMVTILDLQALSHRIVETIAQTMGVEKVSLFLLQEEKGGYYLFESRNIGIDSSLLSKGDPLPQYLQSVREIVIREELMKQAKAPELEDVIGRMSFLEADVSIPLISKGRLVGMINLSHKFNRDVYSQEDVELLSTLANQAAVAIENARLYEDLKRSKSYMRRADRLASLGTLTAGLAHEIRNPLVAIKTFTQLLPQRLEDEEFLNHFLNIASGEVDRISSLVNELLDFARPSDPKLELEDINNTLDGMILLVSTESKKKQIRVVKNYDEELAPISIDKEQIKQVFLNILLNAIEATPEEGSITVKTRSFEKPGGELYVQIEFTDTGCGIPSDQLEEIFNPFFTTKSAGSGLGLSISHQIIEDHHGYIVAESELSKGASFFVNLPLQQDDQKRRKSDDENRRDILTPLNQR
jgi:signal transduction histidine kinase